MLIERHAKPRSNTMRNHDRLRCELAIDHRANMHSVAPDIDSLLRLGMMKGPAATLLQRLEYLFDACSNPVTTETVDNGRQSIPDMCWAVCVSEKA